MTADTITLSWGTAAFPSSEDATTIKLKNDANDALVAAFNDAGGVAGRDVVLAKDDPGTDLMKIRDTAYTSSGGLAVPDASNGRDACDAYSEGAVFALLYSPLVAAPYGTPAAGACLNAQGQPVIGGLDWSLANYDAAPASAGITIATDRFFDALTAAADDSEFFDGGGRTAIITDPTDTSGFVESVYVPQLAKAGVTDPAIYPVSPLATPADALSTVVKLKAEGIDHLVFASKNSFSAVLTLVPVMQEQGYLPKMLTVDGADWVLISLVGTITVDQALRDALVTYQSKLSLDVAELNDAQKATPGGALWTQVIEANPTLLGYVSLQLADALELLKAAIEASGSAHINAQAFTAGLAKIPNYASPLLISTAFGPERHDGGAGLVRTTYSPDCGCTQVDDTIVTF